MNIVQKSSKSDEVEEGTTPVQSAVQTTCKAGQDEVFDNCVMEEEKTTTEEND